VKADAAAGVNAVMPTNNESNKMVEGSVAIAEDPNEPAEAAVQRAGAGTDFNQDEVAALAYNLWQERGCPNGSDQEDWFRAETELKNRRVLPEAES
jgi:hypothetical protein